MVQRAKIRIKGVVQGVGFRPFVFRLAKKHDVRGSVRNDVHGVLIDAQGNNGNVQLFLREIQESPPPLARITELSSWPAPAAELDSFEIIESASDVERSVLISPDIATCSDCLRELFDPNDRRYRYPFINCTNCGPRYTITHDIPYDRPNTSMKRFKMCAECQREYESPLDRRFHAQPNACPVCGPQIQLLDGSGGVISVQDVVDETVRIIRSGKIVAVKALGGFHLAVDASNNDAVMRLRLRKHREEKPFAIMSPDLRVVETYAEVGAAETKLLQSPERPIVLLKKKPDCPIAESVAPDNAYLGVMLPYTPLHHVLLRDQFTALVMTSGNLSEEPIAKDNDEAIVRLRDIADYFLVHDRDILIRSDDSVVRVLGHGAVPLRRSRGFVPMPIMLEREQPQVLACGAEIKNTVCLTKGRHAFLSQHIGDLENAETLVFFEESVRHLRNVLQIEPEIVAHDLHPRYLPTQWAIAQAGSRLVGVQHHHAHIAACLAENQRSDVCIGLALDGTGYGPDHTVWGGEILVADLQAYERVGCLETIAMPGGDSAVREPWRMALVYLARAYGERLWQLPLDFVKNLDEKKAQVLLKAVDKDVNAPKTSSCGRLFDAIAALVGLRQTVSFEGQAAMELEMAMYKEIEPGAAVQLYCKEGNKAGYRFRISESGQMVQLSAISVVRSVVDDLQRNVPVGTIAFRFHQALADELAEVCCRVREECGLHVVALSGGCFQNAFLASALPLKLQDSGFEVLTHRLVPPNDGGVALGQAVVAGAACN